MSKRDFYKKEGNRSQGTERAKITMAKNNQMKPRVEHNPGHKKFYSTQAWVKARARKLKDEPLCQRCKPKGILKPAYIVHHIQPLDDGGEQLFQDNLMSLCSEGCHRAEHKEIELMRERGELPW